PMSILRRSRSGRSKSRASKRAATSRARAKPRRRPRRTPPHRSRTTAASEIPVRQPCAGAPACADRVLSPAIEALQPFDCEAVVERFALPQAAAGAGVYLWIRLQTLHVGA